MSDRNELFDIADKLMTDSDFYNKASESCAKVFKEQQGALDFVLNLLQNSK